MYTPASKPVQLVKNFFDVPAKKRKYPMMASVKHDGQFAFLRKGTGYSRTGQVYRSLQKLAKQAYDKFPGYVIIGEFMVYDENDKPLPVNEISGHFRRDEVCEDAVLIVHDIVCVESFDAGYSGSTFAFREELVEHTASVLGDPFLYNVQTLVYTEEEAVEYANAIIDAGGEGAVFKDPDGDWRAGKRNEMQMKIKGEVSFDLEVVDIEAGKGKYADTLGVLLCKWTDGRVVRVSGMTDAQRDEWWTYPGSIIGCIVQVDGMCLTPDGMIREPRFKQVRCDKDEADA